MELNWTVLTYFVVILFAVSGFFKGWWKEGMVTVFLAILVFLLQAPDLAQSFIDIINRVIESFWSLASLDTPPTIDAGDANTWLIIMILFIMFATLLSRSALRGSIYAVRPTGSVLGSLLGALNGFLIINLVREYIDGRNLPGGRLPTEIASASGSAGTASSGVVITAVDVPSFTILDSFIPWLIIGLGLFVLLALLRNRVGLHSNKGFRRIDHKQPYGYQKLK